MANLFQVSYERFIEEVQHEKITAGNRNQLELEDLGNMWAFYLNSLDRPQSYVFVISKKEISEIHKQNLFPISKQVDRRITDSISLIAINKTLQRIEENLLKLPGKETIIEREVPVEVEVKK